MEEEIEKKEGNTNGELPKSKEGKEGSEADSQIPAEETAEREEKPQEEEMKQSRKIVTKKGRAPKGKIKKEAAVEKGKSYVTAQILEKKGIEGLKRGAKIITFGVKIAQEKAGAIFESGRCKVQRVVFNKRKKEFFTRLGSMVFDLLDKEEKNIAGDKNVRGIINKIKECNEKTEAIK